jgi:hypothetical protein
MRALKASPVPLAAIVRPQDAGDAEARVRGRVREVYAALVERVAAELALLPFASTAQAQAALDARNARYRVPGTPLTAEAAASGNDSDGGAPEGGYLPAEQRRGLGERLEEAERVAERFVARRLQPAVARVRETSPEGLIQGAQRGASWARGVWDRLNGSAGDGAGGAAPPGLPPPASTEAARAAVIEGLHAEIEDLEGRLQEASKARESRLRKAGIQGRARLAAELRQMDNQVVVVSRALAVRTLQLELEFVAGCLEAEAVDVVGDPSVPAAAGGGDAARRVALALARRGSSDEVALLVAEFGQLDGALAGLAAEVEVGEALFMDDGALAALATEIPDLRARLGLGDAAVFGGAGWSLGKLQMQLRQSAGKVGDGVMFGVRGVRLLAADVGAAGGLFWRALAGGTLRPREVAAIRRTARDVLTFIPFTIILILPLTPVGHVLIFGFIQRYFPSFFPSQFTSRRQDLMMKYEELKRQLQAAEVAAEQESDEMEFQRAAAAAALALGGMVPAGGGAEAAAAAASGAAGEAGAPPAAEAHGSGAGRGDAGGAAAAAAADGGGEGPAAAAVRKLEEQLAAAADSSYTDDGEAAAQR